MTTFSSSIRINKPAVPTSGDIDTYKEQLDIHDAIEAIANELEAVAAGATVPAYIIEYIDRRLAIVSVSADYTVDPDYGMIRINAAGGDIDITMPPIVDIQGFEFILKRIDSVGANIVTLFGDGAELIEGSATGINVSPGSSYTIKAHPTGWDII